MMNTLSKAREFFQHLDDSELDYILQMSKHEDSIYNVRSFYATAIGSIMFGNGETLAHLLSCIDMHDEKTEPYSEVDDI